MLLSSDLLLLLAYVRSLRTIEESIELPVFDRVLNQSSTVHYWNMKLLDIGVLSYKLLANGLEIAV